MISYIQLFLIISFFNVWPALAPPTWVVLGDLTLKWGLNPFIALFVGVLGAATGRGILYLFSEFFYPFLPDDKKAKVKHYRVVLYKQRFRLAELIFLYSLGPLPSNVIFILGGLIKAPFLPIATGFVLGRLLSYGMGIFLFNQGVTFLKDAGFNLLPYLDFITLLLTLALVFIDWEKLLDNHLKKIKKEKH